MSKYKRTLEELKKNAVLHWPEEILQKAGDISVLPKLLQTQDSFISVLKVADKNPLAWKSVMEQGNALTGPIFLKHLMVMTDIGGEALNKLPPLKNYCPGGILLFDWEHQQWEYQFKEIQEKCSLTNSALQVDSKKLFESGDFTDKMLDVTMLLLFASTG